MLLALATNMARANQDPTAVPDWLEPRGLSVIELVGQVPDQYLQGSILSYGDFDGIVVYESGSREGSQVVVTASIYPRVETSTWAPNNLITEFGCLGQSPMRDHMGSVVPASTLRVYDASGAEVTQQIDRMFITRMGLLQPLKSSLESFRYPEDSYGPNQQYPLPLGREGLFIPPNAGCWIKIPGANYYPLTGVFTLEFKPSVAVQIQGSQRSTFQSYIGPGNVGIFTPLMNQMVAKYGGRHGRIPLSIPPNTTHFLLRFPPTPGDAYTDTHRPPPYLNADRLSAGTYRLSKDTSTLGADLTTSAAFPVEVAWRDADQASGTAFLPVIWEPTHLAPLEYVLPAGIAYNKCFATGGCPDNLLQQIYDTVMTLEIIYLTIVGPETDGDWVALHMAGPAWTPSSVPLTGAPEASIRSTSDITPTHRTFVPMVMQSQGPRGDIGGWFDPLGRMLGFSPDADLGSQRR
jgi:hypothetical protein